MVCSSLLFSVLQHLTSSLVSAAGIVENYVAHEYPTEKIKKLMDVNVMGSWYCALEAAKRMPEGGSIVLVGSMSGSIVNVPQPQTPYNFSSGSRQLRKAVAVLTAQRRPCVIWRDRSRSSGPSRASESTASRESACSSMDRRR